MLDLLSVWLFVQIKLNDFPAGHSNLIKIKQKQTSKTFKMLVVKLKPPGLPSRAQNLNNIQGNRNAPACFNKKADKLDRTPQKKYFKPPPGRLKTRRQMLTTAKTTYGQDFAFILRTSHLGRELFP